LEYGLPILAERGIPAVTFVVPSLLSTETDFWWSAAADLVAAGGVLTGYEGLDGEGVVRFLKTVPNEDRLQALEDLEISAGRPPAPRLQLTPEDLLRLRDGSVAIGNHTWSHPCLNRCEPADVRREIGEGHRVLEQILGEPPRWFAYPNGDWDPVAEQTLRELGYEVAFLFDHLHASPPFDPMKVSRLRVNSDTSTDRFMAITSGLHPRIHRMRGRN
jgi:peptidoglycan/xylan/chitin deacetylase (PgdA/CDA1 family)